MTPAEIDFRSNSNTLIREALQQQRFFQKKPCAVSFFQENNASVVALIESGEQKIIFKTCFKKERAKVEATTFKEWTKLGIKTPKILGQGSADGYSYFFMEYIQESDAKSYIAQHPEKKESVHQSMGEALANMHCLNIKGFGKLSLEGGILKGTYVTFAESLMSRNNPEAEKALSYFSTDMKSTIGHFDFDTRHIFMTDPLTFFDPDPAGAPAMYDLAFFLIPDQGKDEEKFEMRQHVLQGYKKGEGLINTQTLTAGLVVAVHEKAYRLRQRKSESREARAVYMIEKAGTLEKAKEWVARFF